MDFETSKTYENVKNAYNEKLKVSSRYEMYGHRAHREDYKQISNIFCRTSLQQLQHAKVLDRILNGGTIPDTYQNLEAAVTYEQQLWENTYKGYAKEAREEGFEEVAAMFERIATADRQHGYTFRTLFGNMRNKETFCRPTQEIWVCNRCGYVHWGECAPEICPICNGPQGNYERLCDSY